MLTTREANEADYPLIADSFWRVARSIPSCYGAGRKFLVGMLDRVIADPNWLVTVLYETDVPDETIGWAIRRNTDELFFIAIKPRYQRLGMGRFLLDAIGVQRKAALYVPFVPPRLHNAAVIHGYDPHIRPYIALTNG